MIDRNVTTADEARDLAMERQSWASEHSMSWSDMIDWQSHFETLAERWPELRDEFEENGVI